MSYYRPGPPAVKVLVMSKQKRNKRSTNVSQTFLQVTGMKPKRLSLFPNLPHRKRSFLFGPGEQILEQIETICSQQDKFGNDAKTFCLVSKMISECLSFRFYVTSRYQQPGQTVCQSDRIGSQEQIWCPIYFLKTYCGGQKFAKTK